jgi:2-polyprenyl-6-methoxyphenol hydroxylase-like FAD-dependent oxidoreductase
MRMAIPMNSHAVIIGGGIGGLLAAHALAGRFERITVLERDRYSDAISPSPPARRGVPQSRCPHMLMAAGAALFDELMPGWQDELVARGASSFDASAGALLHTGAGTLPRTFSGIATYACSRALLEKALLRGLSGKPNVHMREGHKVLGLLSSKRGERVVGVHAAEARAAGVTTLLADLVVDASGAGSTLPRWIAGRPNGAGSPVKKTVVKSGMQYVSRWFHIESAHTPDWRCLSAAPTMSGGFRSAMMLRAEENRWGVVLLAPAGVALPRDDRAFLDFIAGLGDGELRAALARARPVSSIHCYGPTSSRMMHYHSLPGWPAGLIAIGDSVCTLDPYFGLGMTATARGVALLRAYLDQKNGGEIAVAEFQRGLAALNTEPWRLATNRDLDGRRLASDGIDLRRLYEAAPSDPRVAHALLAVHHLLRPAETLKEFAT